MKKISLALLSVGAMGSLAMAEEAKVAATVPAAKVDAPKVVATEAPAADIWAFLPNEVAKVNGKAITKAEIISIILDNMPGHKLPPEITEEMLQNIIPQVVKRVAESQVLLAEAAKANIVPSAEKVIEMMKAEYAKADPQQQAMINNYISAQKMTFDQFAAENAKSKMLQEQFALQEFLNSKVSNIAPVTDAEAKTFYDDNQEDFKMPGDPADTIRASHILISVDAAADQATKDAAKAKIEDIKKRLDKGESFETLALENSGCPSKNNKGSLSVFGKGKMVKEFEDAAFALKEGQISEPVQTQFGYHIIRRDASEAAKVVPFAEAKDQIIAFLTNTKKQAAIAEEVDKILKTAKIELFVQAPTEVNDDMDFEEEVEEAPAAK